MSRVLQPTVPQQGPVLPGTQVITQLPMATAVNAGDYVYATSTGYGVAASTGGIIYSKIPMSGTYATGYVQSGSLPGYQYGPVAQIGTYTGTTYTAGQLITTASQINNVAMSGYGATMAALSSGNFVYVYRTTTNSHSFKIISSTGTLIAGPTVVSTSVAESYTNQYIVASPLAAGGFVIAFYQATGNNLGIQKYAADGTLLTSTNISLGSATSSWANLNFFELSDGSFAFVGANPSGSCSYLITNSSFTITKSLGFIDSSVTYYGGNGSSYYLNACALYGGGFVVSWFTTNASQNCINIFSNSGTALLSSPPYNNNTPMNNSSAYRTYSICPTSDGYFAIALQNNNDNTIRYARYTVSGTTISSVYGTTGTSSSNSTYPVNIFPMQNDLLGICYTGAGNYPYYLLSTASSASSTTWGTAAQLNGNNASALYLGPNIYCCAPIGKAAYMYVSSTFPTFTSFSSLAVTNGSQYTGLSFAPPNYYLLGVAANTVSSGQTANVVINGAASLNSNYPSLTSVAPFDYSGTGPFGNSGTVYGRTVTMKGLE